MDKIEILDRLLLNHKDNVDQDDYILQKDIVKMSDYSKASISNKFGQLEDEGYIKLHTGKTKTYNSMSDGRCKIYVPTLKGIEHGGLVTKFNKITAGAEEPSIFNRFNIGLADMHGKLHIKIPIKEIPDDDGLVWKGPNDLNNGVKQYIRYIEKAGDRVSIEKYEGPDTQSIILKPHFISDFDDSPEDLISHFIDVAWAIWTDLQTKGYKLAFPQGPEGEAKFTLRSPLFKKIGYTDSDNVLIDFSKDEAELHPTTGSLQANKIMSKLLLESPTIKKKFNNDVLSEEELIKGLDEIGEYSKLTERVKEMSKKQKRTEKKLDTLVKSLNKLLDAADVDDYDPGDQPIPDSSSNIYR